MNLKKISISNDLYNDIEKIRKKLMEKGGLHKDLSIRETMEIIWNMKGDHGISLENAIQNIRDNNIKIVWGTHGRGSKKHRNGRLKVSVSGT